MLSYLARFEPGLDQILAHRLVQRLVFVLDLQGFLNLFSQDDWLAVVDQPLDVAVLGLARRVTLLVVELVGPAEVRLRVLNLNFDCTHGFRFNQTLVRHLHLVLLLLQVRVRVIELCLEAC